MKARTKKILKYSYILFLFAFTLYGYIALITDDGTDDLGDGYTYILNQRVVGDSTHWCIIPGRVDDFEYDNQHIIVKAFHERDSFYERDSPGEYFYKLGYDTTYYWIIDKKPGIIYGPLTYDEYKHVSDSLNVKIHFS